MESLSVTDTNDYKTLTFEQKLAFHGVLSGQNTLITGGGGVGKSRLIASLERHMRDIVLTGTTGISSVAISGVTIDSFMGFRGKMLTPVQARHMPPEIRRKLKTVKTLLIEEASMNRIDKFEAIDARLRAAKGVNKPFGGVQIVLVGDFCQLEPIVGNKGNEKATFRNRYGNKLYAFESDVYQEANFVPYVLTKYIRQSGNAEQRRVLRNLRMGHSLPDAVKVINQLAQGKPNRETVFLRANNKKVKEINDRQFHSLPGQSRLYHGTVTGDFEELPVPRLIELKKGARVMICANNKDEDYYNGDVGVVTYMSNDSVTVNLDRGGTVEVTENTWEEHDYTHDEEAEHLNKEEIGSYKQLPIKLAYAITIHKSQGLTLEHVSLDLDGIFANFMTYVGLSRVRNFANLHLERPLQLSDIKTNQKACAFTREMSLEAINRQKRDAEKFNVTMPDAA